MCSHLTHYLDVGNPLGSSSARLIGQDGQDKVAGFGHGLSDQEGVRLVSGHQELLSVGPGQVAVVPPETQEHRLKTEGSQRCSSCLILA